MKAQQKDQEIDCTQFVLWKGLETALAIFGEQVWDKAKLTFEQWDSHSDRVGHNQAFDAKVLAKLVETASTSGHWLQLWGMVPADSSWRPLIIKKIKEGLQTLTTFDQVQKWQPMSFRLDFKGEWRKLNEVWLQRLAELANSFEEWSVVYWSADKAKLDNSNHPAMQALDKMANRAMTAGDWERVYHESPKGSLTQKRALSGLEQLAGKSFDSWHRVWSWAKDVDDDLAKRARMNTLGNATTFGEWHFIFACETREDADLREFCIRKLVKLAETFNDWLAIYQAKEVSDSLKASALGQLVAKAGTLDEWLSIWYATPEGSAVKAQALKMVRSFVKLD